jgi:hypothetical protein
VDRREARTLLTKSLVFVPSPVLSGLELLTTAAIASDDMWAAGNIVTGPGMAQPVVEHFDGRSWSIVPSPRVNPPEPLDTHSYLAGLGVISANDIWAVGGAVGKSLTEHWDGTSWSVIASPNPGPFNFLFAATALSDGTVAAVGAETDQSGNASPLILQDPHSAPKTPSKTCAPTSAAQTPLDAAAVDELFAAAVAAGQPLSLGGHSARAHKDVANGALNV